MNEVIVIIPVSDFSNSKTRLSPFLSADERKQLLKCMLEDIVDVVREYVFDIIITSKDKEVLRFAKSMGLGTYTECEHEDDFLNNALIDCMSYVRETYGPVNYLLLPADIPLISKSNIYDLEYHSDNFVIAPSRGGGTNLLFFNSKYFNDFKPSFGEFSFLKHLNQAQKLASTKVFDSFLLSVDINTPEDLGELLIHGSMTRSYDYLCSIGVRVKSSHTRERLNVFR